MCFRKYRQARTDVFFLGFFLGFLGFWGLKNFFLCFFSKNESDVFWSIFWYTDHVSLTQSGDDPPDVHSATPTLGSTFPIDSKFQNCIHYTNSIKVGLCPKSHNKFGPPNSPK